MKSIKIFILLFVLLLLAAPGNAQTATPTPPKTISDAKTSDIPDLGLSEVEMSISGTLAARILTVFVETNRFQPENFYADSYIYKSAYPSDDLFEIQHWATSAFERVYRSNYACKKCGVILGGLMPAEGITTRLYDAPNQKHERLNKAIDEINKKFGKGTVHLAIAHKGKWQMKRERMSPRYTTRFAEIATVK